jgi:hypothetical protein
VLYSHRSTVLHALGVARGAGGVAETGRLFLVDVGPDELRRIGGDQVLVDQRVGGAVGRQVSGVGHRHEGLYQRHAGLQLGDLAREGVVEEQEAVLGVIGHPDDLVVVQARVDGVQHRANAGDREIELEVAVRGPRQGRDPVAGLHAHGDQGVGHPPGAPERVGIAIAMDRALDHAIHHLAVGMVLGGVFQDRRQGQRPVHHQGKQGRGPPSLSVRNASPFIGACVGPVPVPQPLIPAKAGT